MKISVKNSQTHTRFVDNYIKTNKLSVTPELRKEAITNLKIAGVDLKSRKTLGRAVIAKTFSVQDPQNLVADKGSQSITASIVVAGQMCPRCSSPMVSISLGSEGEDGYYCTNPRCRVSAYSGDIR